MYLWTRGKCYRNIEWNLSYTSYWGGDETVRTVRQVPLAPMANELAFPERFSLAAFSTTAVLALDIKTSCILI